MTPYFFFFRVAPPAPNKPSGTDQEKKKKEELFSIRKYYGDNEGEVFIMDAKCSGNIGRYLNVSFFLWLTENSNYP